MEEEKDGEVIKLSEEKKKLELYVVESSVFPYTLEDLGITVPKDIQEIKLTKPKLPRLPELINKLQEDLRTARITNWEATIETYLEVSSGSILPGGKAGIKTTLKLSSK